MKKFKDVAHLYLGCRVVFNESTIWTLTGVHRVYIVLDGGAFGVIKVTDFKTVRPMLRPLSSMTADEMKEHGLLFYHIDFIIGDYDKMIAQAKATAYLLSKHFDLFDLIQSGQAIDHTKNLKNTR